MRLAVQFWGALAAANPALAYVPATASWPSRVASRSAAAPRPGPFPLSSTLLRRRPARVLLSAASEEEDAASSMGDAFLMASLAGRVGEVRELEALRTRFEEMSHAWVLVFAADTDDEAVYSIKLPEYTDHVVVAFEVEDEAHQYAASLESAELDEEEPPSVQALDLEALVVSSREASFRVALVLRGDLRREGPGAEQPEQSSSSAAEPTVQFPPLSLDFSLFSLSPPALRPAPARSPFITLGGSAGPAPAPPPPPLSVSFTVVPEELYADKRAGDFLDPLFDAVWVLVHDEGTPDEQLFSLPMNGTRSVVCFKEEAAALRCVRTLEAQGGAAPVARERMLEEVLDAIDPEGDALGVGGRRAGPGEEPEQGRLGRGLPLDVCLVDEVVGVYDSEMGSDGLGESEYASAKADLDEPDEPDAALAIGTGDADDSTALDGLDDLDDLAHPDGGASREEGQQQKPNASAGAWWSDEPQSPIAADAEAVDAAGGRAAELAAWVEGALLEGSSLAEGIRAPPDLDLAGGSLGRRKGKVDLVGAGGGRSSGARCANPRAMLESIYAAEDAAESGGDRQDDRLLSILEKRISDAEEEGDAR